MKALLLDPKLFLSLTLISLFITLFDSLGILKLPKSLLQQITIPVEYGLYRSGVTVNNQIGVAGSIKTASQENRALKQQLSQLLIENALLQKKLSETQILVDQYNKLNPQTFDLLPTRVIGINRYLIIDRGSDEGITSGQAVVYKDNFVGLVKDVSPKTSRVILPQDPDSKIPVFSQNTEGTAKGMLIGQFGSELLIDKILHQEVIKAGDLVYSEGTEGKLPKGLIIGKVTEVFERQNEIFKQAKVDPVFDIADLDVVFAIRNP